MATEPDESQGNRIRLTGPEAKIFILDPVFISFDEDLSRARAGLLLARRMRLWIGR